MRVRTKALPIDESPEQVDESGQVKEAADSAVNEQREVEALRSRVNELENRLNERANRRRRYVERDQLFSTFLDNINEVVWMNDRHERQLMYVSPAFERVWGRKLADIYEDPLLWQQAIHKDDRERVSEGFEQMWDANSYAQEYRILRPDGSMRWIWDRSFPVRGADGEAAYIIGIAEDITTRKQAELEVRRADRLASIGTLAAGIAHEINNPIGAILLAAEFARDSEAEPRTKEALGDIASEAARCGEIIQSILQFAREEAAEKVPGDINALVKTAASLAHSYAETCGGTLALHLDEELPAALINDTEITQVVVNLVRNAFEAGASNVEIRTEADQADTVGFAVSDDGPGIEPEVLKSLFDPFFTTRRDVGGTGLGLSISHGIITEHKGTIQVTTELGKGTRMNVRLPVAKRQGNSEQGE